MQRTALLKMYSDTDVEGIETEMGEELSKEISNPQSDRHTQSLGCDLPGFTTLVTRARFYTLPDPETKQTKVKQGFINPERMEIRGQRSPASSPNHGGPDKRVTELPHSQTSMQIRILITRPRRVVEKRQLQYWSTFPIFEIKLKPYTSVIGFHI